MNEEPEADGEVTCPGSEGWRGSETRLELGSRVPRWSGPGPEGPGSVSQELLGLRASPGGGALRSKEVSGRSARQLALTVPGTRRGCTLPGSLAPLAEPEPERRWEVPGPERRWEVPGPERRWEVPGPERRWESQGRREGGRCQGRREGGSPRAREKGGVPGPERRWESQGRREGGSPRAGEKVGGARAGEKVGGARAGEKVGGARAGEKVGGARAGEKVGVPGPERRWESQGRREGGRSQGRREGGSPRAGEKGAPESFLGPVVPGPQGQSWERWPGHGGAEERRVRKNQPQRLSQEQGKGASCGPIRERCGGSQRAGPRTHLGGKKGPVGEALTGLLGGGSLLLPPGGLGPAPAPGHAEPTHWGQLEKVVLSIRLSPLWQPGHGGHPLTSIC
ncbi:translation initiation factor IF-2-like [Antechinus flavipes]|uniref:translation initiation factor IF-2-like n=1 Tax=Antechinus flavipes TaxID=38775 RepID=UPI0022368EAB|nr:translation initiation factor IF-2-like [Antechinus flavipes]